MLELARRNPKVFIGGSLNHPCQEIQDELEEQRADIETLKNLSTKRSCLQP